MSSIETEKWRSEFDKIMSTPPGAGTILKTLDGSKTIIRMELVPGKAPFMYSLAWVPCIVGQPVGWYTRSVEDASTYGWKCILLPKARDKIIRERGIANNIVGVKSLKVIRTSTAGKSLLVEIREL